jgi:hypothetical protein
MKRFVSWAVSAGVMLAATAANAQMPVPYRAASDFDGPYERPYGAVPPAPPPAYNYGGYAPALLPMPEVYAVLRDNGFSPLGAPYQRGFVYIVAAVDRNGEDGRLVIDARNGRIIRFMRASWGSSWGSWGPNWGYGGNVEPERMGYEGDVALPPPTVIRGVPRPPAPIPHVASRAVPLPAPKPSTAARPQEPTPQQSAAIEGRPAAPPAPASAPPAANAQTHPAPAPASATPPAQANASPPPNATIGEAKPAPMIRPTQPMPAAQGLE